MTTFSMITFDTTPGAVGETAVLAPPAHVTTAETYLQWLREARHDPFLAQVLACAARTIAGRSTFDSVRPNVVGPLADTLNHALKGFATWLYTKPQKTEQKDGPPARSMRDVFDDTASAPPLVLTQPDSDL